MRRGRLNARSRAVILVIAGALLGTGATGIGLAIAGAAPSAPQAGLPIPTDPCALLPLPGLCDSSSPSASASASASASPSASASASPTASPTTPTVTPTVIYTVTPSASPTAIPPQKPTVYLTRKAATKHHPTRVVIKLVANGSRITSLLKVRLRHCTWNLGSAKAQHFDGGRKTLRIVVTRKHQSTKGAVRFRVVDAAGQHALVKSGV